LQEIQNVKFKKALLNQKKKLTIFLLHRFHVNENHVIVNVGDSFLYIEEKNARTHILKKLLFSEFITAVFFMFDAYNEDKDELLYIQFIWVSCLCSL
jgi:hypothetical protein